MNNFTKEELNYIRYCVIEDIEIEEHDPDSNANALLDKLDSMLENYCQHEWVNATYCEKCNRNILE